MLRNLLAILGSIINIIVGGDLYDYSMRKRIFTLIKKQDIHASSQKNEGNGYMHDLTLLIILQ